MDRHLSGRVWRTKNQQLRIDSNSAGRMLEELGLKAGAGAGALGKRIPAWVFRSSPAIKRAFLRGYAEADGHRYKNCIDAWRIVSNNEDLIRDARYLAMECFVSVGKVCSQVITNQPPNSPRPITTTCFSAFFNFRRTRRIDVIESVEPAGRALVYDLTVEGAESFIAEGFVVHNTRWHHDDLAGRLIEQDRIGEGEGWRVINLPALAEHGEIDILGRRPDEALWPEAWPLDRMKKIRRSRGSYIWNALYQGRPTPLTGGMFNRDHFEFYTAVSSSGRPTVIMFRVGTIAHRIKLSDLTLFATVDLASSTKTKADYTVVQVWGFLSRGARLFLLDQERERVEGPELVPMMWRAYRKWDLTSIWVEQVNFELSIIADARAKGLPVRSIRPKGDKVTRALPATAKMEGGLILFPLNGAKWWDAFESELLAFNKGKNDDQVDCLCLDGTTKVKTSEGEVAIADIKPGDLVWTRGGLRKVLWSGCSGITKTVRLYLSNGQVLIATHGHRIWTQNRGWVSVGSLSCVDKLMAWQSPNQSSSTDMPSGDSVLESVRVLRFEPAGIRKVFDLTVKDDHEFFASGVLVHNSYAVKVARKIRKLRTPIATGYGGAGDYTAEPRAQRRRKPVMRPSTVTSPVDGPVRELLVRTGNRQELDRTLRALHGGLFLVVDTPEADGSWAVRAFPAESMRFLKFAIQKHGYAEIVGERDMPS